MLLGLMTWRWRRNLLMKNLWILFESHFNVAELGLSDLVGNSGFPIYIPLSLEFLFKQCQFYFKLNFITTAKTKWSSVPAFEFNN